MTKIDHLRCFHGLSIAEELQRFGSVYKKDRKILLQISLKNLKESLLKRSCNKDKG